MTVSGLWLFFAEPCVGLQCVIVVFLVILTIQCKAFNLIRLCGYLDGSQTDYSSVALPCGIVDCSAMCDCACADPEGGLRFGPPIS